MSALAFRDRLPKSDGNTKKKMPSETLLEIVGSDGVYDSEHCAIQSDDEEEDPRQIYKSAAQYFLQCRKSR